MIVGVLHRARVYPRRFGAVYRLPLGANVGNNAGVRCRQNHSTSGGRDEDDSVEKEAELEREERLAIAKGVQDLVRRGVRTMSAEPFVKAADKVGSLPSGSVARRYLSGFIMNGHGNLLAAQGQSTEACGLLKGAFEHAMEEATQGLGDDKYVDIVSFASDLAINYAQTGELESAEKLIKRALYWANSPRIGPDHNIQCATYSNLGLIQALRGSFSSALDSHEKAKGIQFTDDRLVATTAAVNLSISLRREGIWERGRSLAMDALGDSYELLNEWSRTEKGNLGSLAQINLLRAASLVNASFYKIHFAETVEDIQSAHAFAKECESLDYVDKVPSLLLLALTSESGEDGISYLRLAQSKAENISTKIAIKENQILLEEILAESKENTAADSGKEGLGAGESSSSLLAGETKLPLEEAARSGLVTIGLQKSAMKFWLLEQYPFIHGLTLKGFIESKELSDQKPKLPQ